MTRARSESAISHTVPAQAATAPARSTPSRLTSSARSESAPRTASASEGATAERTGGSRKPKGQTEHQIQTAILKRLALMSGVFAERQNTGAMSAEHRGRRRFVRFSLPGAPDIRVCVAGRYLALEVKRPGEKQNANQIAWQKNFERAGGLYAVVTSVDEAHAAVVNVALQARAKREGKS